MATIISVIAILISAAGLWIGYWQFQKQLNRSMYEKRLSEVYAPLMSYLIKQEEFRKELMRDNKSADFENHSFINISNQKIKEVSNGGYPPKIEETWEVILSHKEIPDIIDRSSLGMARPQLLKYHSLYKLFLDVDNKEKADEYGKLLLAEIINGYNDTIKKLGMGDKAFEKEYEYITKNRN